MELTRSELTCNEPYVDGRNPATPFWNADSPLNTNKQWFVMVSRWCRILFIHSTIGNYELFANLRICAVSQTHRPTSHLAAWLAKQTPLPQSLLGRSHSPRGPEPPGGFSLLWTCPREKWDDTIHRITRNRIHLQVGVVWDSMTIWKESVRARACVCVCDNWTPLPGQIAPTGFAAKSPGSQVYTQQSPRQMLRLCAAFAARIAGLCMLFDQTRMIIYICDVPAAFWCAHIICAPIVLVAMMVPNSGACMVTASPVQGKPVATNTQKDQCWDSEGRQKMKMTIGKRVSLLMPSLVE